jgi:23S rRNA (cytosine1962-C5)-methyltransferase
MKSKPTIWRLRFGADKRVRAHHPWVYSNELAESPKGLAPGSLVELQDSGGQFIARGYGNPASLIAFRVLSRDTLVDDPFSQEFLVEKLARSASLRSSLGFTGVSHRLCYGEADYIPGLVIDRYILARDEGQVFAVQAHTAGAESILSKIEFVLETLNKSLPENISWSQTAIIIRNDVGVRKLEGLNVEEPRVLKEFGNPTSSLIKIRSASSGGPLTFSADLLFGQKTGFFLDQFSNIQLAAQRIHGQNLRILDLCCYVGQWSAQLARHLKDSDVTLIDASAKALEIAKANVEREGAKVTIHKMDVMDDLGRLSPKSYDVIICDPPALIKGRKDVAPGRAGYLKLNTQAMSLLRPGGFYISCSCSALFLEEEFTAVLSKAARRNQLSMQWVGRGTPSPDHPLLTEFSEGHYLKCWIGKSRDGAL